MKNQICYTTANKYFNYLTSKNKDFVLDTCWMDGYLASIRYYAGCKKVKICGGRLEFSTLEELETYHKGIINSMNNLQWID